MPKNHETVLYAVDKVPEDILGRKGTVYFPTEVKETYVFRTRAAAEGFKNDENKRARKYRYCGPRRMVWGPDN